jgi:putative hydrolase of the HAD superfamily
MDGEHSMARLDMIAFDADDTLWHTEHLYAEAQATFQQLLAHYHAPEWIASRLYATEVGNLQHFGYGIKSYILSMIETAIELSEGRMTGRDIQTIIDIGHRMLAADVQLLDHASEVVSRLAATHRLMLITKGDLYEQEGKVVRSGLATFFKSIEIVTDKTDGSYQAIFNKHGLAPARFLMVGNSLRSDIWPVLNLGAYAAYVPYHTTWAHEVMDEPPAEQPRFYKLDHLGQLPELIQQIQKPHA